MKSLSYQRDYWKNFARTEKKDELSRDLHDSWSDFSQSYQVVSKIPEDWLAEIEEDTAMNRVLDFGVGMGRNYTYLDSIFNEAYGFDTEEMIIRLRDHDPEVKNVSQSIDETFSRKYSLVYESVSMQHMPPQEVILYLNLISSNSKYFFSWTRSYNDFLRNFQESKGGINLFSFIKSLDLFDLVHCSIGIEEASCKMDETHYRALYKCKNFSDAEEGVSINSDGSVKHSGG